MKRLLISIIVVLALLIGGVSAVFAAKPEKWPDGGKPQEVITRSNGFPSGEHETLNIHGKKAGYQCEECVPVPGLVQCNVVNIPEEGTAKISYVSGKKVKIDELTVFDSCAGWEGEDDRAEVWLPYEAEGYWVFARALGKPAKGDPNDPLYDPRSIIFRNEESDNPTVFSLFGDVTEPGDIPLMLPLGLITKDGAYVLMSTDDANIYLVRFDSEPAGKGRGKTQGKDITDMFMWTGWVFHPILDVNLDDNVNELDVIADSCPWDADANGVIDATELQAWKDAYGGVGYDANGDGPINELDVIADSCPYDADANGVIDATEFQDWLDDNTQGWVFPPSLDLNGDGDVNELDVAEECGDSLASLTCPYDLNSDGVIDPWDGVYNEADEFENWLEDKIPGDQDSTDFWVTLWAHYDTPVWVFTIADLVYNNQVITNQGIKNLQIRFYPVATTNFDPAPVE